MNSIPAQGAPGSLIRTFQEHPWVAVELYKSAKKITKEYLENDKIDLDAMIQLSDAIRSINEMK